MQLPSFRLEKKWLSRMVVAKLGRRLRPLLVGRPKKKKKVKKSKHRDKKKDGKYK